MKPGWLRVGALAGAAVLLAAGCAKGPSRGPGGSGQVTLTGAGATFPYPLYSKWFDEYEFAAGVRINYQSIGSGGGIQQLKAGTVDFGGSDTPLSDQEAAAMPGPVVHIPTVAGAVVIAHNLPKVTELRLSGETIADIYLGEIRRWNDSRIAELNPGVRFPDAPIAVVYRSDGSGTTSIFTHYLAAVSRPWAGRVGAGKSVNWPVGIGGKGNEGVAGVVKQTPASIGYVELAYAEHNRLPYARVRNAAGSFVAPTIEATAAAAAGAAAAMKQDLRVSIVNSPAPNAYPIAGFTYLLVYRDQRDRAKGEALAKFLDWALDDGQAFAEPLLYAPLPAAAVELTRAALRTLTFRGKPLLAEK
ncbi:MAG TPA: phosphate ABC transporter substrate-binding protein PstS [Armatimonadota bacterium]|nr:phosphate ABC transporter substrate-binding protein PstS [Armatimonadota bacterium]